MAKSELFDSGWYVATYADVETSGVDPISHYLAHGAAEGRNPGPGFHSSRYLNHYPDVAEKSMNPLVHYLKHGRAEGRIAQPVGPFSIFDAQPELAPIPFYYSKARSRRVTIVTDTTSSTFLFGGVITAVIVGVLLAERLDAQLRLITRSHAPDLNGLSEILRMSGLDAAPEITALWLPYGSEIRSAETTDADIFLTTSWWTTWATLGSVAAKQVFYLIQDDERIFYPYSDQRLRCQEVLDNASISFVVNSKLLFDHFEASGCSNLVQCATWFEPAFPESVFHPGNRDGARRRFVFYARPRNPRNLYLRGLEAVSRAIRDGILAPSDWDVVFMGHPDAEVTLPRGIKPTLVPTLPFAAYAELLSGIDLGLALMYSPHPSYPPLDLAASGAVALTNRYGVKQDLSAYSSNILLSSPSVEDLAALLRSGVSLALDLPQRQEQYQSSQLSRDWRSATGPMIDWLTNRMVSGV